MFIIIYHSTNSDTFWPLSPNFGKDPFRHRNEKLIIFPRCSSLRSDTKANAGVWRGWWSGRQKGPSSSKMSKRGPKIGDAISLWNFAPSPGFTKEEVVILKYCLMYYGVGRWVQILDSGFLPGKLIQQLNCQTQRLIGQQSLAAYTGLHVNVDQIRKDNEQKEGERKGGLLINSGPNPTREIRARWQAEAKEKYGLTEEERQSYKDELDAFKLDRDRSKIEESLQASSTLDTAALEKEALVGLLKKLRANLVKLNGAREAGGASAPGDQGNGACDAEATTPAGGEEKKEEEKSEPTGKRGGQGRGGRDSLEVAPKKSGSRTPANIGGKRAKRHSGALHTGEENKDPEALQSILDMGFNKKMALDALKESNFVLQDAVLWLMQNVA